MWWSVKGTGARESGECWVIVRSRKFERLKTTYDGDFVADDFDFWFTIMLQRHNPCQTGAVDEIPSVRQTVYSQSYVPHLCLCQQIYAHARVKRTRSLACTHSASLSTTSLRRRTLSSMRTSIASSSDVLNTTSISPQFYLSRREPRTYRPGSYSLDAMGEISEWIVTAPSNGRSGVGRTILPSTTARTLVMN